VVRWQKVAIGLGTAAAVGVGGFYGYFALVKAGILKYNRYDRRERGSLKVGALAPDLALTRYDGAKVRLSELWAAKPVVLIFGSCT
jgi:hypothetical protein